MDDSRDPLERLPGESLKAHAALRDYALMGPGRSLSALVVDYRTRPEPPPTKQLTTLKDWSVKFTWQARVGDFDTAQYEAQLAVWEERKRLLAESDWEQGAELRRVAGEVLRGMPAHVQRSEEYIEEDGKLVKVVTLSMRVTLPEVAKALESASKLQRLASDEPTEHVRLSGAALDRAIEREESALARHDANPTPANDA